MIAKEIAEGIEMYEDAKLETDSVPPPPDSDVAARARAVGRELCARFLAEAVTNEPSIEVRLLRDGTSAIAAWLLAAVEEYGGYTASDPVGFRQGVADVLEEIVRELR